MATKTFLTTETQDTKGSKHYTISEAPTQEEVTFAEGITITDAVSGVGLILASSTIVDEIGLTEGFEIKAISPCQPIGGGTWPRIDLQQATCGLEIEGIYQTIYSHEFTDDDFNRGRWWLDKIPVGKELHEPMESGSLRGYPYKVQLHFEIDWWNPLCETAFLKFMYQFALDWYATTPNNYKRRIVLFPSGTGQVDFMGDTCKGIKVKIANVKDFWVRLKDYQGRRGGGYQGTLKLDTDLYYPGESPFGDYTTSGDVFTGLDEWQDIIPWGGIWET